MYAVHAGSSARRFARGRELGTQSKIAAGACGRIGGGPWHTRVPTAGTDRPLGALGQPFGPPRRGRPASRRLNRAELGSDGRPWPHRSACGGAGGTRPDLSYAGRCRPSIGLHVRRRLAGNASRGIHISAAPDQPWYGTPCCDLGLGVAKCGARTCPKFLG